MAIFSVGNGAKIRPLEKGRKNPVKPPKFNSANNKCFTVVILLGRYRTLVKSAYRKTDFLISQPKHMLWVLKRTVSIRRVF